jgi:glycosyltransferase involved in cell wall biosynthesis
MKDVLVIIPAFNEENGIGSVLKCLQSLESETAVLVVNDGSADRTAEVVARYPHVHLVNHPINLGYGSALQTAFRYAALHGYEYVVQFDADGQHHIDDLRRLIAEIRAGAEEIAIGSRALGAGKFNPGLRKRIAFLWFTTLIRLLTGKKITDPTSGLRGLKRRAFSYYAYSASFPNDFPDTDTIIHMLFQGFRIREFPVRSLDRTSGVSMHSGLAKHAIYMLKVTLSIVAVCVHHLFMDRGGRLEHRS